MRTRLTAGFCVALIGLFGALLSAQSSVGPVLSPAVRAYVSVDAPVVALTHVRIIDGTGAPARADQTIIIRGGDIAAVGDAASTPVPPGARVTRPDRPLPAARLRHAARAHVLSGGRRGVQRAGLQLPEAVPGRRRNDDPHGRQHVPYADLNLKKWIDEGKVPEPDGCDRPVPRRSRPADFAIKALKDAADAGRWSTTGPARGRRPSRGTCTSRAPSWGPPCRRRTARLQITGHLCSVTFSEAADLGIDELEHGLVVSTDS